MAERGHPAFQAIEQPRLYVAIARQIAQQIRDGALASGAQLPAERDLARQFQVSRTTVREAMIALETMGLIDVRTGDGTYVKPPAATPEPARVSWESTGDPGPSPIEQFRVRLVIECAAAADAAAKITPAELAKLKRALDAMAVDIDGPAAEAERFAFHDGIATASRNSIIIRLVRELWTLRAGEMWRTMRERAVRPEHHVQALQDRVDLYEALRRGDALGAEAAMRTLMERIRRRYFEQIDE